MPKKKLSWSYDEMLSHLQNQDPLMAELVRRIGKRDFDVETDHFESLTGAIISQQISTKAAQSITLKLTMGMGGSIRPEVMAGLTAPDMRGWGISPQKASYLIDLARHFAGEPEYFSRLHAFSDQEVMDILVKVRGIGPWTAQMFLIFTLGRPDVFAPDDLGLRNAMINLYGWKKQPDRKKLIRHSEKWAPYRSVASRYLWLSLAE